MSEIIREATKLANLDNPDWIGFLVSTYVLAHQDRIGTHGSEFRTPAGLPALWGHSYVRTYYKWVDTPPPSPERMEGGIATSYYVVNSLSALYRASQTQWSSRSLNEIAEFFNARTRQDGVGVLTMDEKGFAEVKTHLRHTCFAYLIMADLAESPRAPERLRSLCETSARALAKAISREELSRELLMKDWPVGAIASYVAARDHLNTSSYRVLWPERERHRWSGVRERLLDIVCELTSAQLSLLTEKRGAKEHYPYWHPIKDLTVLRLHSTLGCLSLIGRDLAIRPKGRKRIGEIVATLRSRLLNDPDGIPRFSEEGPPSISAAAAMLKMFLGGWYNPTEQDIEPIVRLIKFISSAWKEPAVYKDYWTEFTAPLLGLEPLLPEAMIPNVVTSGERLLAASDAAGRKASEFNKAEETLLAVLADVTPTALDLKA